MENLKQNDSRWKNEKIQGSNLTLGSYGCAITCLANLCNFYGKNETPLTLNTKLKFDNGLVYWDSLPYSDIRLVAQLSYDNNPADLDKLNSLLKENPLIIETRVGFGRKQSHFVIIWNNENGKYLMSDPNSSSTDFESKYGSPSRWIYRAIIYKAEKSNKQKAIELLSKIKEDINSLEYLIK